MRIFHGFDNLKGQIVAPVCTLGSFDGIHRGHRELIGEVISQAKACRGESVVLTFEPHPRIALGRAEGLTLLTTLDEKATLLEELGVDNLIVIPFDEVFSRLAYRDFFERYLVGKLNIKHFVMGYNHRLGRGSEGNFATLSELGRSHGFEVSQIKEWRESDDKVSSTVIRNLITEGEISHATRLLGRPYMVIGEVDSSGQLRVGSPIKTLPPKGLYIAKIDNTDAEIEITNSEHIGINGYAPQHSGKRVKIELSTDSKNREKC
ncbi:MAG: FAD synthetase [Rikenellaceae bacterium]